ncbi:MAG: hypothetical protein KGL10_05815 [Alphaproteobacteria bacterium]|nr:hypothetical protein [Alphaproteobacteria bacterium]MDE2336810.1 hypothetical protein [Alphaproteobacteria bacterium]
MFEKLTDFSFQRSRVQALGFYLVLLVAGYALSVLAADLAVMIKTMRLPARGNVYGVVDVRPYVVSLVCVFSTAFAALIVRGKGMSDYKGWICVALAAALSFVSAPFSFIPVAYLTTLPKGHK